MARGFARVACIVAVVAVASPAGWLWPRPGEAGTTREGTVRVTVLGGSQQPVDVRNGFVTGFQLRPVEHGLAPVAFVWHRGRLTELQPLVGTASAGVRVNRRGHVAGNSFDDLTSNPTEAVLWVGGRGRILVPGTADEGATEDVALDLNDRGQVLVQRTHSSGDSWPAIWQDGRLIDAPHDPGVRFGAAVMNRRGQVVGSLPDFPTDRLVMWEPGAPVRDLGPFGEGQDIPLDINDRGQVLVLSRTSEDHGRYFLWDDGTTTDLGTLGGDIAGNFGPVSPEGRGLNKHGQAALTLGTVSGDRHAVLWDDGELTDLGTLGGALSIARDIDDRGRIVGAAQVPSGEFHAFAWHRGQMTDLGALAGGGQSVALDIDDGQAIGFRYEPDGTTTGILWTLP